MTLSGSPCTWRVLSYKDDSPLTRAVVIEQVVEVVGSSIPFLLQVTVVAGEPVEVQVRENIKFMPPLRPSEVIVTGAEVKEHTMEVREYQCRVNDNMQIRLLTIKSIGINSNIEICLLSNCIWQHTCVDSLRIQSYRTPTSNTQMTWII